MNVLKISYILALLLVVYCMSCSSRNGGVKEKNNQLADISEAYLNKKGEDTSISKMIVDSLLETLNTSKRIQYNSPTYRTLKQDSRINFKLKNLGMNLNEERAKKGKSPISFDYKNGHLNFYEKEGFSCIDYYFLLAGTNEILPYIKKETASEIYIDYYKVAYPSVEITDGQYEVISRAQPVEAIVKLSTKVSTSFIKNRKIYFKDKELPFYTALSL